MCKHQVACAIIFFFHHYFIIITLSKAANNLLWIITIITIYSRFRLHKTDFSACS